jgi:hypothetical protein
MNGEFQFPTPERTVELFLYAIGQLTVDDDGLAPGNEMADLNAIALLSHVVKALAISPRDIADVLLFELADATEALIVTELLPPEGDVTKRWTKARVELMKCELSGL